jgi:hypothetical protein
VSKFNAPINGKIVQENDQFKSEHKNKNLKAELKMVGGERKEISYDGYITESWEREPIIKEISPIEEKVYQMEDKKFIE